MATQQPSASTSAAASASASSSSSANPPAQEFTVRLPNRENQLKFMMMKFNSSNNVDFTKCPSVQIERENNFKEYKLTYDVDSMPKFGAGSEFGREQREIARRKKYGIHRKAYDPEEQPWLLKMGTGKQARQFKGVKEGGVLDNASYYIFTQCPDGAFEAHPVEDWYNFAPVPKYKSLSHEEAEDEFKRRDRTLNYFSIMLKKRLKGEPEDLTEEEEGLLGKNKKKKKKSSDLFLTDMDEWAQMSDDDDDSDVEKSGSDEDKPKKKDPGKDKASKKKNNSDSEAFEESDDMDEGKEVDYMTDTDSDDEDMYLDPAKQTQEKYEGKGVEDEEALREDEEDEEEEKKENEDEDQEDQEEETGDKKKKKKEGAGESDSESSSGSDSDSDPEKEGNLSSAIFLQKKPSEKKGSSKNSSDGSANNSRSATPTNSQDPDKKGKKRKTAADTADGATSSKKARPATPSEASKSSVTSDQSQVSVMASAEGITEDAVRRYLMRKPITTKELLQRFRSKHPNMSKEQLFTTMGMLLKKISPDTKMINDKKYLTLKKT